jgi:hypothetical protein
LTNREIEEREERRQGEMRRELQKAIKRKAEREKEKEARDEEMVCSTCLLLQLLLLIFGLYMYVQALLQRMKEAEMFKEWESQEDDVGLSLSFSLLTYSYNFIYLLHNFSLFSFTLSRPSFALSFG